MSSFLCSIWWFLLGALLGWLLAWWLSRNCCKKSSGHDEHTHDKKAHNSSNAQSFSATSESAAKVVTFDKAAALLAGIKVKGLDDLEIIEGIGPKISELLKADGIKNFAALAVASQTTLQGILDKAGARYKLADPGTWPEQAKLANTGKWAELKALQDNLSGGKR